MSRKREYETPEFAAMVRRQVRALSRRVGEQGDIAALTELTELRELVDQVIGEAIAGLRAEPWSYSWSQIGDELGITPQAARQRWTTRCSAENGRRPGGQPARLR